jgi:hypothetical protein
MGFHRPLEQTLPTAEIWRVLFDPFDPMRLAVPAEYLGREVFQPVSISLEISGDRPSMKFFPQQRPRDVPNIADLFDRLDLTVLELAAVWVWAQTGAGILLDRLLVVDTEKLIPLSSVRFADQNTDVLIQDMRWSL